jgi:hypothetical protein
VIILAAQGRRDRLPPQFSLPQNSRLTGNVKMAAKTTFSARDERLKDRPVAGCRSVTLVCGAPASGKTTYVEEHRRPGDLVWDFDFIVQAITGLGMHNKPDDAIPLVLGMRSGFLTALRERPPRQSDVWVIGSCPTRKERADLVGQLGATLVLLTTDEATCTARMKARDQSVQPVRKWFARYEP